MNADVNPSASGEPKRSQLRRILDDSPEARGRIGRAVLSLGLTAVATIAVVGLLLIWHLMRRARLIRERLGPPKDVRLVDPLAGPSDEFTLSKPE